MVPLEEPYEARVSLTGLGEAQGEVPRADSADRSYPDLWRFPWGMITLRAAYLFVIRRSSEKSGIGVAG